MLYLLGPGEFMYLAIVDRMAMYIVLYYVHSFSIYFALVLWASHYPMHYYSRRLSLILVALEYCELACLYHEYREWECECFIGPVWDVGIKRAVPGPGFNLVNSKIKILFEIIPTRDLAR